MKNRKVKIRATIGETGAIDFEVDGVKAQQHRLKLDKDSGSHSIDYDLQDHSGKQLRFDSTDPIWAGENCPCPPPQGMNSDQLTLAGCVPQTLTLINENSGAPREIRYQLNFIAADGSAAECDPIIDNGGGNAA